MSKTMDLSALDNFSRSRLMKRKQGEFLDRFDPKKNTIVAIQNVSFDMCNRAFAGKTNNISLQFDNGKIERIKINKNDLFKFIFTKYMDQYEKLLNKYISKRHSKTA